MKFLLAIALAMIGLPAQAAEFTLLIYEKPAELSKRDNSSSSNAYWESYNQFAGLLVQAGVLRGGTALDANPSGQRRNKGGADQAITGARLGGYFVIEAPTLDAAREWAGKAPASVVAVEVRPHRTNPVMQSKH